MTATIDDVDALTMLKGYECLNLTTFRKSGTPVVTTVWFALEAGKLYIWTAQDSGKVKRIRNNPLVSVAPSSHMGKARGPAIAAVARILSPGEQETPERPLLLADDFPRGQRAGAFTRHLDFPVAGKATRALDPLNLVLLEEEFDALGDARDDLVLPLVNAGHVDRGLGVGLAETDAPLRRLLRDLERMGVFEERFGRDAAPVEAGSSERGLALDDGDAKAELRCANGGDVPAGAGPDHYDVKRVSHPAKCT